MRFGFLALAIAGLAAPPALGQALVGSPGPDSVSVTVYRDPNRGADQPLNLAWLNGYALITERRTIAIPAGEAEIRFEGVAGGILPESAIVTGLPEGVLEKNRDARLLSPASLLDSSLGRRVHIRRTDRATGRVSEEEAVIRSGADGAVVLQTEAGFEALRCTGLADTPIYREVPEGLSAKPTLSVRARSSAPARATITLSYLATGFDWQANYIAELAPGGQLMDLFAWLTLANGDETGFAGADTQAVAGRLNREHSRADPPRGQPIRLQCWPQGTTTSDLQLKMAPPPPSPPPPPSMDIVVSGSRIRRANLESASPITVIQAEQEELGDLKLYRIPEPVTVAAHSQKQVALLRHEQVPVKLVYRFSTGEDAPGGATATVTGRNRREERLGVPLPAGAIAFFEQRGGRRVLVGHGYLRDLAVGEDLEIEVSQSIDVQTSLVAGADRRGRKDYRLTVTNAKPYPVRYEAMLNHQPADIVRPSARLSTRDGFPLWKVTVPANGTVTLRYRVREEQ